MILFFTLFLGHLIADFPLQTNAIYQLKTRSTRGLLLHVSIHLAVTAVFLAEPFGAWAALLYLGTMHFLTDWVKLRVPARYATPGFLLDQLAHILVLCSIALAFPTLPLRPMPNWLLGAALAAAAVPALAMFLWVAGQDLALFRRARHFQRTLVSYSAGRLWLLVSQRGGLLLMAALLLAWLLAM